MDEQLKRKGYAVVLSKAGASELGAFLSHLMKKSEGVAYFNCKTVDPKGPYFHMVVEDQTPTGPKIDFEIQIPHAFVIAVAYTADLKRIGFLSGT
jgi:hypothetical protein